MPKYALEAILIMIVPIPIYVKVKDTIFVVETKLCTLSAKYVVSKPETNTIKTTAKTIANPFKQYTKIGKSFLCSENADAQALPNDNRITIIKQSALLFPTASTCDASGSFNKSYTNHALDSIKESTCKMKYIPTNAIMKQMPKR